MEFGKYLKPNSQRQLDRKNKRLEGKSEAKLGIGLSGEPILDPFGTPPMGWMPMSEIMSLMADRDAELRAKNRQS